MSRRLQLDVRNLSLGMCHLVNAYEVKAGIAVIAGNTVWSMRERLAGTTKWALYKYTYLYLLPFTSKVPVGNKARRAIRPTRKPSCLIFLLLRNYGLRRMGPVNGRYCSLGLITHSQFQRRLVHGLDVSEYERNEGHSRSLVIGVCVCVRVWQCQRAWE